MDTDLAQLAGKRVFLTGHTGFKGTWLSLWLSALGAEVYGYSLEAPTTPNCFAATHAREALAGDYVADIRDRDALQAALDAVRPAAVLHLAAQPLVRESYRTPLETVEVNALGTATLLEAIRTLRLRAAVVVVTSDKCYENTGQARGYRETDAMGGHDPYSASKAAAELLVASWRRSFFPPAELARHGVALASARAGNVFGGGDWAAERLVVDIVEHLHRGEAIPVRSPRAVRPWQHVLEPLHGYLALTAALLSERAAEYARGWNFGPDAASERPVQELVELFCRSWGTGTWRDVSDPQQPYEPQILRLSHEQAATRLAWRPRWNLETAVARTVDWYRAFYARPGDNHREACEADIRAYAAAQPQE